MARRRVPQFRLGFDGVRLSCTGSGSLVLISQAIKSHKVFGSAQVACGKGFLGHVQRSE